MYASFVFCTSVLLLYPIGTGNIVFFVIWPEANLMVGSSLQPVWNHNVLPKGLCFRISLAYGACAVYGIHNDGKMSALFRLGTGQC